MKVKNLDKDRECSKCGSLTHFIRDCPHQESPDQGNGRWAGHSQK